MKYELVLYEPHAKQLEFHESTARFRIANCGRQFGKSTMCSMELLKKAWEKPGSIYWFISPIFAQSKVQYRRLKEASMDSNVVEKYWDSDLQIQLVNKSIIRFVSGENYELLRGSTLDGVVIDEVRDQASELWPLVIRPMLSTTQGWAAFVSTPNGFDSFYDLFEQARADTTGQWSYHYGPSSSNPLITQVEIEAFKSEMSESQFAQEILAEFRELSTGLAYHAFSEATNVLRNPPWSQSETFSPHLPIIVGCDFNLTPMAWTLSQLRTDKLYVFDEIFLENSHTIEATQELLHRIKSHPAPIWIVGDASSHSGQRAAAGRSDYDLMEEILRLNGIKYENKTPASNPLVRDRVNIVNARFKDASGNTHVWIHPRCKNLIKDFKRVAWKKGAATTLDQTTDPMLTHVSDSLGYVIYHLMPLQLNSPGVLRLIHRT